MLSSNDFRTGFDPSQAHGPAGPAVPVGRRHRPARPARAAVAAGHRAARPHPLPQAGHPRVQRARGREAARAHRADRRRPARRPRTARRCRRPRRGLLHAAAGHGDRRDPRRAGRASASGCSPSATPPPPASTSACRWRQFRQVEAALADFDDLARPAPRAAARRTRATTCSASSSPPATTASGLDERELKATAGLVLAAGFETTVNLLGNGVALLLEHPDQLAALRRRPGAVAERGRRDPAPRPAGAAHRPHRAARHRRRRRSRAEGRAGHHAPGRRRTATRRSSTDPDPLRRHARATPRTTCPSPPAGTSASAPRWPGWRARSACACCSSATPSCRLPGARRRETRILRGYAQLPVRLGGGGGGREGGGEGDEMGGRGDGDGGGMV